jgi:DNA-binding response OmpR family regulator
VVVTALTTRDHQHLVDLLELGAFDVVVKPFDPGWLVELVATEVASSRRGDQRAQVGAAARNADCDSGCGVAAQTATPSGAST